MYLSALKTGDVHLILTVVQGCSARLFTVNIPYTELDESRRIIETFCELPMFKLEFWL